MKKRLVAGLLAAGLSTAAFVIPAEARCESGHCFSVFANQGKKITKAKLGLVTKAKVVKTNKIRTASTVKKARIATLTRVKPAKRVKAIATLVKTKPAKRARASVATLTKAKFPRKAKATIVTVTKTKPAKRAAIATAMNFETGSVRHAFQAPIRKRAALAVPVKHRGGGSVVAMIESMAPQYGVPTWFALRIAKVESGYNPNARGRAGELGVFQMKCATARGIGYRGNCAGLLNARTGVQMGLKHLAVALKSSRGNLRLAASKHNGGLGRKSLVPKYVAQIF